MTDDKPNTVALFGGSGKIALTGAEGMKEALHASADDDPRGLAEGGVYINFSGKRGVYEVGPDKEDIDPQEIWLINVRSFESGWMCWKGGRPVAKRMATIFGAGIPDPDFTEHGPFNTQTGEGWFKAKGMMVRSLDSGVQGLFTTNSKSGVGSMASLQRDIAERLDEKQPSWPIVMMQKEKFMAQGNTNYKPTFEVYGYLGDAQVLALSEMSEFDDTVIDEFIKDSEKGVTSYDNGEDEVTETEVEAEIAASDETEVVEAEVKETRKPRSRERTPARRRRASV